MNKIFMLVLISFLLGCESPADRVLAKLNKIDEERSQNCQEKIKIKKGAQTDDCRVINNFSPTRTQRMDDCGKITWPYSTIQCGDYKYFGWQTWNDVEEDKMVWITGNQYFLSCQWPQGIPDEQLKSEMCKYDFKQYRREK